MTDNSARSVCDGKPYLIKMVVGPHGTDMVPVPITDKVLVDLEKLRKIEWMAYDESGNWCVACNSLKHDGHEKNCWLSALLKEKQCI